MLLESAVLPSGFGYYLLSSFLLSSVVAFAAAGFAAVVPVSSTVSVAVAGTKDTPLLVLAKLYLLTYKKKQSILIVAYGQFRLKRNSTLYFPNLAEFSVHLQPLFGIEKICRKFCIFILPKIYSIYSNFVRQRQQIFIEYKYEQMNVQYLCEI